MNRLFIQLFIVALVTLATAACGPSQAELDATTTQAAVNLSGTQTVQAPAATATFTPSPTNTVTPTVTPTPTRTPTLTPTPTPFGGGSKIAFSSNRDGNSEIYIMDSDGSHQKRLTNSPTTEDWFPESFPDGTAMLYWSYAAGDPPTARLNWLKADGSQQGTFVNNSGAYSSVSSLGLAAITIFSESRKQAIAGVSLGGGEIVRLADDPAGETMPAWSPDGRTIVFVSYRDGPPHLYLMDWDGNNQRRLTDSDLSEIEPDWSPDGTTIAFLVIDETTTSNIYLVNVDGTDLRPLTEEEGSYNENPAWSPDGTMIAFWSNRTGDKEIYAIRLDGSGLVNLTNNPADDENPSWSK